MRNKLKTPLGPFVIVSGPSGSGKTRLITKGLKSFPQYANTVSCTTRKPRQGEQDGDFYHFISLKEFEQMKARGEFAEWAKVHNDFYATSKKELERLWGQGLGILKDIDVQGRLALKKLFPHSVSVFILPPSVDELSHRLMKREAGLSQKDKETRLSMAIKEMALARVYDHKIINDSFETAWEEFQNILIQSLKNFKPE